MAADTRPRNRLDSHEVVGKLFVGGLSYSSKDIDLQRLFEKEGKLILGRFCSAAALRLAPCIYAPKNDGSIVAVRFLFRLVYAFLPTFQPKS